MARDGPDTWWPTPEPPHRINQIYLEPVLFAHAASMSGLRILSRTRVLDFEQNQDGVLASTKNLEDNSDHDISARYLIGCDGAHSEIRRKIGARLSGDRAVIEVQSTYIRAPTLLDMMPAPAWAIDCINPRSRGLVFAIDGRERWLVHNFLRPGESPSAVDRQRGIWEILGVKTPHSRSTFWDRRIGPGGAWSPTASVTSVSSFVAMRRISGCHLLATA